jgi:hypothetical protein
MFPSDGGPDSPTGCVLAAADLLARATDAGGGASVPEAALQQVIGGVLRLYDAAIAHAHREIAPVGPDVSTTAAIALACALVRSQSLTPFDFALWFSHTAATGRDGTHAAPASPARTGDPRE